MQRYFIEDADIVCRFCRKTGHIFRNCKEKEISCYLCRSDHDPTRCPLANVCFWCFRRGHEKMDCRSRHISKFCMFCKEPRHSTQECDLLWRDYIYNSSVDPVRPLHPNQADGQRPVALQSNAQPIESKIKFNNQYKVFRLGLTCRMTH
jgi:hypothetical protein